MDMKNRMVRPNNESKPAVAPPNAAPKVAPQIKSQPPMTKISKSEKAKKRLESHKGN